MHNFTRYSYIIFGVFMHLLYIIFGVSYNQVKKHETNRSQEEKEMTKQRFVELFKLLNRECRKYDDDCSTCPYSAECDEYSHCGDLDEYNDMCHDCKKWMNGCEGTTNRIYTGCIYREI